MPDYSMPPDERPADMAELARLTAIELRKRGFWAAEHVLVGTYAMDRTFARIWFSKLPMDKVPMFAWNGTRGRIADEIQPRSQGAESARMGG